MTPANRDTPLPTPTLSDAAKAALMSVMESGEQVEQIALAVGCSLVLTDRRLLLVRDGAAHRPRSGIGSWPTDDRLRVHLEVSLHGTPGLSITRDRQSASVFLIAARIQEVRSLVAAVRRRIETT